MSLHHLSEVAGIDIANWVEELGVIEDVVRFKSQLQPGRFGELRVLGKHDVHVIEPGAMERIAAGISDRAQSCHREVTGVEVVVVDGGPWIERLDRATLLGKSQHP